MGQHVLSGNPPLVLRLRQSARARRISLRISGLDGKVTLTIPRGVAEREALAFAREKEHWLRDQMSRQADQVQVGLGRDIPVHGIPRRIVSAEGRILSLSEGEIHVPGDPATAAARLQAWLRAQARDRLAAASDHHADRLGLCYARLSIRDTRSRWGSCSAKGTLMYSWRLIMAPPDVLDYVAAHEVAHLQEMNHSAAFWAVVAHLMPAYQTHRKWLRAHGASLHRFRFAD